MLFANEWIPTDYKMFYLRTLSENIVVGLKPRENHLNKTSALVCERKMINLTKGYFSLQQYFVDHIYSESSKSYNFLV